ncbi:MAG: glutamine-hydrolyzing carbamoyl-phosphate synthase small subunit [Blautia sp.]|nr:glutamine-hydrolyzing carbamoyl-phosphate synthase small subunit [Blautia sp.]
MAGQPDGKLICLDGTEYVGRLFGAKEETGRVLELVFNTSMAGYQEIFSDPSYTGQAVVMTYPLIGVYGVEKDFYETQTPSIGALLVHEYNQCPANGRGRSSLEEAMVRFSVPGLSGIDTRRITRKIREEGSQRVLLTRADMPLSEGLALLKKTPAPIGTVSRVSCPGIYHVGEYSSPFHVVVVDCGMKKSLLTSLLQRRAHVTVVPYDTPASVIRDLKPDGVFLSNGPGDPQELPATIKTVRELKGSLPLFGVCLGHQILSLSYGAKTYKLRFGHRGGNHPVKNLLTGSIEITSQNHSYAVEEESLSGTGLTITHRNLLDHTVEGVCCQKDAAFSVQYHPEGAPGPLESRYLFDQFFKLMEG